MLKLIKYAFFIGIVGLLLAISLPRHYTIPAEPAVQGFQFWQLPTGSKIAYYKIDGKLPKKASPIIYLHGGPGGPISAFNIKTLAAFAEDGYDVFLYDQIGGGRSDRLDNIAAYTADRHARDLEAIVAQLNAQKVILLGQSWGGILATLYAAAHPDKIEKIIFTCPGPIQPGNPTLSAIIAPDSLHISPPAWSNAQGQKLASNLRSKTMEFLASHFGIKLAGDEEADAFACYLNGFMNRSLVCDSAKAPKSVPGAGYYVSIMTVKSLANIQDPRPKLKQARYPVLVLKGQCDNQKWGVTKEYLDVFQNHQLTIIPNAGHAIAVEQPEIYAAVIRSFLKNSVD